MRRSNLKHGDAEITEPRRVFGPSTMRKNLDSTQEDDLKSQNRLKRQVFMSVNINFSRLKQLQTHTHTHVFFIHQMCFQAPRSHQPNQVTLSYLTIRFNFTYFGVNSPQISFLFLFSLLKGPIYETWWHLVAKTYITDAEWDLRPYLYTLILLICNFKKTSSSIPLDRGRNFKILNHWSINEWSIFQWWLSEVSHHFKWMN